MARMKSAAGNFALLALLPLTLAAVAGSGVQAASAPAPPSAPVNISDLNATNLDGTPFHGSELAGKTVLEALADELKEHDFEVLGGAVYSGNRADVLESVEKHGIDYRIVMGDPALVQRFGVIGFPTYLLMAPDGSVHKKYVGAFSGLHQQIKADVLALGNGSQAHFQAGAKTGKDPSP